MLRIAEDVEACAREVGWIAEAVPPFSEAAAAAAVGSDDESDEVDAVMDAVLPLLRPWVLLPEEALLAGPALRPSPA